MKLKKLIFYFTCAFFGMLFFFGFVFLKNSVAGKKKNASNGFIASSISTDLSEPFLDDEFKEPFNVLILGGDRVNKNTDTIIVANVDLLKPKITLLSIPRDTRVLVDGKLTKINSAYPRGKEKLAIKTVSDFLNIDIKYYVYLDTKAFREIVDLFGGVEFNVPVDIDYDDPGQDLHIHLKKGQQHLDGDMAEQFMRFRHYNKNKVNKWYDGSDLKRIEAQQSFIKEFIKQKFNFKYLSKAAKCMDIIYDNIDTNIDVDKVAKSLSYCYDFDLNSIDIITLPGEAAYINKLSYYLYDRKKTYEIVKANFKTSQISLADFLNYDNYENRNRNYLRNNPSNAESSIIASSEI